MVENACFYEVYEKSIKLMMFVHVFGLEAWATGIMRAVAMYGLAVISPMHFVLNCIMYRLLSSHQISDNTQYLDFNN